MVNQHTSLAKKRVLITICSLLCAFGVAFYSYYLETRFPPGKERLFYLPPSKYLKVISGNFKGFVADIFYIKGVLAIATKFDDRSLWFDWVQSNFRLALELDRGLIQSYFFAGVVIAEDRESIRKGIDFLKMGLDSNPRQWRIPYWIGFNYYQLGDYLKAIEYYKKASRLPQSPKFLSSVQPMLYYRAGEASLGIIYLESLAATTENSKQAEWINKKLEWLKDIVFLEEKLVEFKAEYGRLPDDLDELVETGVIGSIPDDNFGRGYYFDKDSKRIKSRFSDDAPLTSSSCPRCSE
ncbi:MAG: hypothetical protein ABH858_05635 [Candidatus Omnitrophota bacterium]